MEHKIIIETVITTDDIVNLLAMEGGGFDYWAEICWDENDYEAARLRLVDRMTKEKKNPEDICYEDVCAEILEHGGILKVYDREDDEDYDLPLSSLLNGFRDYMKLVASDGRTGIDDMDGEAADQILQFAVFNEIIYG